MINPTYPTSNWDIANRCNYYVGWATKHSSCSILCTVHKISHMPDIEHMPENSANKQNCRENVCWQQDEYMTLHDQQSHVASLSDCWRVKLCQTASSECFNRQSPCPVGCIQINVVIQAYSNLTILRIYVWYCMIIYVYHITIILQLNQWSNHQRLPWRIIHHVSIKPDCSYRYVIGRTGENLVL